MKHLVQTAILSMLVAVLLANAGVASATTLTSPTGTATTPTIKAESEGHVAVDIGGGLPRIECSSTLQGTVESHGEGKPATTKLAVLTFTGCTEGWHVTVVIQGMLSISGGAGYNGAVTWTGATIEAIRAGVTCRLKTENNFMGVIKGGSPAKLKLSGSMRFHSGSPTCGAGPFTLTGRYKVSTPSALFVDGDPNEGETSAVLTVPTGTISTPLIKGSSEEDVVLHSLGSVECASTLEGEMSGHGEGEPAVGFLSSISFSGCTESWHVTAITPGKLAIEWSSGYDGTVISTGATIEVIAGSLACRYLTNNTPLGTITGGAPATIHLEAELPFHSGNFLCGGKAGKLTGSIKLTKPTSLYVDEEAEPAPTLTSPTGTSVTPTIKAESEGHVTLDHPIANIQCQWAFEGTVASHATAEGAKVPLSSLSTTGCTESWHGTTVTAGELVIDWSSGYNGTVSWTGGTVEMTRLGTTCRYKTQNTHLGTLTGGTPATIDIEGKLPFHSGSPLCGEEAYPLTGSFKVTSPGSLYVDEVVEPASTFTAPTGTSVTPTINAESEGHVVFETPLYEIECQLTLEGTVESHNGEEGATVPLSTISMSGCTDGWHGTMVSAGELNVQATGDYDGTVTWSGGTFELTGPGGYTCRFKAENVHFGALTGGNPATIHVATALFYHSGSPLCGTGTYPLTGSLKVSSPSALYIDDAS